MADPIIANEPHMKDYLNILRRRRGIAILFFITTVLVVLLGSFIMKPVYRAKATLFIDLENPNILTASGMVELQSQNYYSYKEYYQSQKEILTSLPIIQKVFGEFGLADTREYSRAKEPIKKFLKTIRVEPVRDTRLLELYVENKNPELAAKIANRIAEIYVKRNLYYISKTELLNLLKNEYLKLESKLSEYSKIYKEGHPEMIRLKKEIDEVVGKIEAEKRLAVQEDYTKQEELLDYKYALEGLKANNVSILAAAEIPKVPTMPKKLLNVVLAVVIGLFGGIAFAFFYEYMDDTIREAADLSGVTKMPFLGSVPKMNSGKKMTEFEKDIFVHVKPKDPIAEAYRSIRTSILFSSSFDAPLKSLVFTSPAPQEGKTATLCNIGIAMAQNQKKVLLVDADMRNPRLHEVFKKENKEGLSTFLSRQRVGLATLLQKTDIENLNLVTSGTNPPNPSELLASPRLKDFIDAAGNEFDFILFDTPPIAILTDAAILSGCADGVILVVESGKTPKRIMERISKILSDAKAKVIGVILNKLSADSSDYYYYTYYYSRSPKNAL
ncbi:MAG: polysaccharide biosynthesis tyrosine autokinase [Candidatus Omnitrophica bacterium]|nr:polysaccharide biosynthesis tyrosine autokinase [Candidatus Omnitrophota bacterium]